MRDEDHRVKEDSPIGDAGRGCFCRAIAAGTEAAGPRRTQRRGMRRLGETRLQAALDALSAHVAVLDADGIIVGVNRAWRQLGAAERPSGCPTTASAAATSQRCRRQPARQPAQGLSRCPGLARARLSPCLLVPHPQGTAPLPHARAPLRSVQMAAHLRRARGRHRLEAGRGRAAQARSASCVLARCRAAPACRAVSTTRARHSAAALARGEALKTRWMQRQGLDSCLEQLGQNSIAPRTAQLPSAMRESRIPADRAGLPAGSPWRGHRLCTATARPAERGRALLPLPPTGHNITTSAATPCRAAPQRRRPPSIASDASGGGPCSTASAPKGGCQGLAHAEKPGRRASQPGVGGGERSVCSRAVRGVGGPAGGLGRPASEGGRGGVSEAAKGWGRSCSQASGGRRAAEPARVGGPRRKLGRGRGQTQARWGTAKCFPGRRSAHPLSAGAFRPSPTSACRRGRSSPTRSRRPCPARARNARRRRCARRSAC